jgi:hypothetical protein
MPPTPKHSSVRARRNRGSTAATLTADHRISAPMLPEREAGWHWQTESWWRDIWASPMAPEFHSSDRHGLFVLAVLVDDYWRAETSRERAALAGEIRLQRQCFGLTPIDRRRLQWEIERTDEAQERGQRRRRAAATPAETGQDPRDVLRAVT